MVTFDGSSVGSGGGGVSVGEGGMGVFVGTTGTGVLVGTTGTDVLVAAGGSGVLVGTLGTAVLVGTFGRGVFVGGNAVACAFGGRVAPAAFVGVAGAAVLFAGDAGDAGGDELAGVFVGRTVPAVWVGRAGDSVVVVGVPVDSGFSAAGVPDGVWVAAASSKVVLPDCVSDCPVDGSSGAWLGVVAGIIGELLAGSILSGCPVTAVTISPAPTSADSFPRLTSTMPSLTMTWVVFSSNTSTEKMVPRTEAVEDGVRTS